MYRQQFAAHGMSFAGTSPDGSLVEIVEIPDHPWFVAVQFHPEFKSQPTHPQPLFAGFVAAAVQRHLVRTERLQKSDAPQPGPARAASPGHGDAKVTVAAKEERTTP